MEESYFYSYGIICFLYGFVIILYDWVKMVLSHEAERQLNQISIIMTKKMFYTAPEAENLKFMLETNFLTTGKFSDDGTEIIGDDGEEDL